MPTIQDTEKKENNEITSIIPSEEKGSVVEEQQRHYREELFLETTRNKEVKTHYVETQKKIILSDEERKIMWDKYKHYVDETVFIELQHATICR